MFMFKSKTAVGIFPGPQGLSIVEITSAGKVKNHVYNFYPKDITRPSGTTVPINNIFDVFLDNEVEIIAFLQRSMRDSRINLEHSDVVICVPNRDLIIRFFEIPPIPRKDIPSSIGFEIKKYIPFRIEDITYDYQIRSQKNLIEVLFAGMKNEDLMKYNSILGQLNINIMALEPSQFSLLRLLKLKKIITSKESVVVAELERGEGVISIVDNAIPCFSRDIKIAIGADAEPVDTEAVSFRIINEVRVSIDYFRRQFLKKGIDRVIILSKEDSKELINNFNKELGMPVSYYNPDEISGVKEEYSMNLIKALGASLRVSRPSGITINLSKKQMTAAVALAGSQQMISQTLGDLLDIPRKIIINTIALALLALIAIFILGNNSIRPIEQQLRLVMNEANSKMTDEHKRLDNDSLGSIKNNIDGKLSVYRGVFKKDFLISEKLEVLSSLMPEGIWLEEISFNRGDRSIYLRGTVYREGEKETAEAPYLFIANLNKSPLFSNRVSNISVKSLRSAFQNNYKVSKFEIEVKIEI